MIEEVEEICTESQVPIFSQLEHLAHSEVHVPLMRADDAVAGGVPVDRCFYCSGCTYRGSGVGRIRGGIDPVVKAGSDAAPAGGAGAAETGGELCG
jgi:hypothetical protein